MNKIKMTLSRYLEIDTMAVETIGHWNDVVAGKLYYRTTVDCPACRKYLTLSCEGCPIRERTNARFCEGTPIVAFQDLHYHVYKNKNYDLVIELKAAAQDCLDFLLKLKATILTERLRQYVQDNIRLGDK